MKKTVSFRATAEPFGSPDGVTKEFQLEYQGKDLIQPIDLAVTAMHQTDWQGRLALSNQPRTNICWNTSAGGTAGTAPPTFVQTTTFENETCVSATFAAGSVGGFSNGSAYWGRHIISVGVNYAAACMVALSRPLTGTEAIVIFTTGIQGASSGNLSLNASNCAPYVDQWGRSTQIITDSTKAGNNYFYVYVASTLGSTPLTVYMCNGEVEAAPTAGVYIPTATTSVTVTDYTVDTSGNVTFGQAPAKKTSLDWDGSATADFVDASDTFLAQYATSPILTSLIQAANAAIDPRADFDAFMANVWDVYTAQGFGLDIWGRIVNIPRTINIPASNEFLGFDEALPDAEPFNQAPFYNGPQAGTLYTLSDDAYRVLILTKALANISSFTAQSMNALLNFMFNGQGTTRGSCYVLETATPMQIQYVFNFALQSWEAAVLEQASLMPRPAGVGVTIVVNP